MPTKKKVIIAIVIIVVIALIVFFVMRRKKKKKEEEALASSSNYQQAPVKSAPQTQPKMRVVPKEDQPRETAPEPKLSVEEIVPEKRPVNNGGGGNPVPNPGVPGTLGVPGNGAGAGQGAGTGKKPAANPAGGKSSLPPEFMINANDPNAG